MNDLSRQERELQSWQTITQLQREVIVLEISDLVHRQLVSSALESDFRTHLEQRLLVSLSSCTMKSLIDEVSFHHIGSNGTRSTT